MIELSHIYTCLQCKGALGWYRRDKGTRDSGRLVLRERGDEDETNEWVRKGVASEQYWSGSRFDVTEVGQFSVHWNVVLLPDITKLPEDTLLPAAII